MQRGEGVLVEKRSNAEGRLRIFCMGMIGSL